MTSDDKEIFSSTSKPGEAASGDGLLLEFASFREFIDQYSARISDEGLFVVSEQPRAVGESVAFEVRLSDDFRLIQGRGTVVWQVPPGTPAHEAGMALRFDEIDEPSRRLITRLVNNHRSEGGTVFDLSAPVEIAASPAPEPDAEELFVTDPRPSTPSPSGQEADELFGESPFQVPAGPETIALPRDLIPSAEPAGLESLIEPEPTEPLHPIGPLAPPEPMTPPQPLTEDIDPPVAPASADFVEESVPENDEDFSPPAGAEPAVLPEITPPEAAEPSVEPPIEPPIRELTEPEAPPVWDDPIPPSDPTPAAGFAGLEPSLGSATAAPGMPPAPDGDVLPSGDGREIPLAPPEAILEPPFAPDTHEPTAAGPHDESAPPELASETPERIDEAAAELESLAADVEMPEPEDLDEDYTASYAGSAATSSGGPGRWLWIGLCLVAVVLGGVAAVRYQDQLREWMPWIPGGEAGVEVAADRPSMDELRARLLGEKETTEAAEALPDEASDVESVEGGSTGDTTPAEDGPSTEETPTGAEPGVAQEPPAEAASAPAQTPVEPPSDPAVSKAAAPLDGLQLPSRVESIDWAARDDATVVTISTAGPLSRESFSHIRVSEGAPREVIKVFGVGEPFPSRVYEVGSPELIRLRTGSHPGGEVHIVADLADGSVRMSGIDVIGNSLRATFSR